MSFPTIVFLDVSTLGKVDNLSLLSELGSYTEFELTSENERIQRCEYADIIISNKVVIDQEIMDACKQLKMICVAATGMNNIDLDYAAEKGINVKNVAGYSTESVAQSTFSMLFYLIHQSRYYDDYVRAGDYINSPVFTHYGPDFWELKNKTFGIIGLGTIGKRVAEIALAFGSNLIYYSTSGAHFSKDYKHIELEELLQISDIVSIHCPLNERTKDLIGHKELSIMKSESILLNMGRGGIVNEGALANAIDTGQIAGAGIDVLTKEPITSDNPLMKVRNKDNLFITPHIAWTSIESRRLLVEKLAQNIKEFLS